jgi:hypothetical protein
VPNVNGAPILDLYAPLSHKQSIGVTTTGPQANLAPTWVPQAEVRRLNAYTVRAAYLLNVARYMARCDQGTDSIDDRREYGDAALLVDRVMAGVLGDTFEIVVDGADIDLPDEPELPDPPEPLDDNATQQQRRIFTIRQQLWNDTTNRVIDEWEQAWAEQPALRERQDWLRDWADAELFASKLVEGEGDTCGLADGVYVLSLSPQGRPWIDVYEPGFYFPVLTDTTRGYPGKVHLAWEYEETIDGRTTKWVRRLTWELGPIMPAVDDQGNSIGFVDPVAGPDGVIITDRLATGDEVRTLRLFEGAIVREYPWNVDGDGKPIASNTTCYFTDGRWKFEDLDARKVDDLQEGKAVFTALRLDLRHDFLPVVHVPNTPASREHFGQSVIDLVLQILDDIQIGDTDIQDAAALAAGPAIALSGDKTANDTTVRPGVVYNLGANGKMDVLDLSKGLEQLANIQERRLERLSVNGRVPAEVLGRDRGEGNASSSGFHELLKFGPFVQLIGKLRMTREPKMALLLKFVQRLGQLAGALPAGRNPVARVAFGSFLPSDRKQLVDEVTELLKAKAISTQTAVQFLVAGGLSIDDARGEVQRIYSEDTKAAKDLADATGSEQLAANRLGLELPVTVPPTPTPVLPPEAP